MVWKTNFDEPIQECVANMQEQQPVLSRRVAPLNRYTSEKFDNETDENVPLNIGDEENFFEQPAYQHPPLRLDAIPPQLTSTLEHIIRQLDIITQVTALFFVFITDNRNHMLEICNAECQNNGGEVVPCGGKSELVGGHETACCASNASISARIKAAHQW